MRYVMSLLILAGLTVGSATELEEILNEHGNAVATAEAEHAHALAQAAAARNAAVADADADAVEDLERLARKAARGGDMTTGAQAWKEILRIDREHTGAREYFAAIGTLDSVLSDLGEANGGVDVTDAPEDELAGAGADPSLAGVVASSGAVARLTQDADWLSDSPRPVSSCSDLLQQACYLRLPGGFKDFITLTVLRPGMLFLVAEPGYPRADKLVDQGFKRSKQTIEVAGIALELYERSVAVGESFEIPAGHNLPVSVVAGLISRNPRQLKRAMKGKEIKKIKKN